MSTPRYDVAVVGGGIVGLATARAILHRHPGLWLLLLEKEPRLAAHQTGHNSGVIHSGIYYRPGSLKAQLCQHGARMLIEFCDAHRIPYRRCGKLIVAVEPREVPALEALYAQGLANGLAGLTRLGPEQIAELEPQVRGLQAVQVPQVAIVDFVAVANALAEEVASSGGTILTSTRLMRLRDRRGSWEIGTNCGEHLARFLVNCGGLHADRIGIAAADEPPVRIVPFRGEYDTLTGDRAPRITRPIYPVPDPTFPFLGVHFTPTLSGDVLVGPNAVLALHREGYARSDVSVRDAWELMTTSRVWRMARRYWTTGLREWVRAWDQRRFLEAARRLVPALRAEDLRPGPSGVRAQAVQADGTLAHDFVLRASPRALHVYNAPSPAATASLAIAETIVDQLSPLLGVSAPTRM